MGRCANCIRLKKECNFFPVDQAMPNDHRSNFSKKETASSAQTTSSQSSPRATAPAQQSTLSEVIQGEAQYSQPGPELPHQEPNSARYDSATVNGGMLYARLCFDAQANEQRSPVSNTAFHSSNDTIR
jgi:hypothetical protein